MPFWILINDFLHDLKTQKTRVFLTTFAIIWGTIAIVLMMAFGRGFKTRMVSGMINAGNQIIRIWGGQTAKVYQGLPEGRQIRFTREDADVIYQSIPQIKEVSPSYGRGGVRLAYGAQTATTYLEAVFPNFELLRTTFESLYPHRYLRMITVQPNSLTDVRFIKSELYRVLGRKLRFDPTDKSALDMWDFVTNIREMNKVFLGIEIFLGVVGGLTLLVAGVGVANIMYVVVKERTREIGIKIAVGARPKHIILQFIFESLLIAVIGGFFGMTISWSLIHLIGMIPVENQGLAYLGKPELSQTILIFTSLILGIIGIIAGVFPASRAAKMDPVECLRYE